MIRSIQNHGFGYVTTQFIPCYQSFTRKKSDQGENLGKGGVDLTPSDERSAPLPPSELPESSDKLTRSEATPRVNDGKLLPRETGHDIGMGSPVPLSKEAVEVITRLRNLKVRGHSPLCPSYVGDVTGSV